MNIVNYSQDGVSFYKIHISLGVFSIFGKLQALRENTYGAVFFKIPYSRLKLKLARNFKISYSPAPDFVPW